MIEKEALVEKEAEISPSLNYYEAIISLNRERNRRMAQGRKVIKGKLIPWEQNRQGMVRWYCNDIIDDTADARWNLFVHEIGVHSGKHIHQGGANLFVLKGKGYTIVDGIRFDWAEGDLILLPIKKHGVEHQHFNIDGRPSRWVAFGNNRIKEFAGRFLEQRVESPDWIKMKNKGGF